MSEFVQGILAGGGCVLTGLILGTLLEVWRSERLRVRVGEAETRARIDRGFEL